MSDLDNHKLNHEELRIRVLYAFIQASAELNALFGGGLKTFERLSHMAAFHVLRRRRIDLNDIATLLGVSRRKVDQLSRLLKDHFFEQFIVPEDGEALQRRIEFILWAQSISLSRLKQVLPDEELTEIEAALDALICADRIVLKEGKYSITTPERRLVRDDWLARVGGLTHQLSTVSKAAFGRFFKNDERAFARTVSLRVHRDRLNALETLYRDEIWPLLATLDAECSECPETESVPISFSVCWAPADPIELQHEDEHLGD